MRTTISIICHDVVVQQTIIRRHRRACFFHLSSSLSFSALSSLGNTKNIEYDAIIAKEQQQQQDNWRWSMHSLAELATRTPTTASQEVEATTTAGVVSASYVSRTILQDVTNRLALQYVRIQDLIDNIVANYQDDDDGAVSSSGISNNNKKALFTSCMKRLSTLQYIHADTHRLCRTWLDAKDVWSCYGQLYDNSIANQHALRATLEQVRTRHATTVDTLVDVLADIQRIANTTSTTRIPQQQGRIAEPVEEHLFHHHVDCILQGRLGLLLLCMHHFKIISPASCANKNNNDNNILPSVNNNNNSNLFGAVSRNQSLIQVVKEAVSEAQHICDANMQMYPETNICYTTTTATTTTSSDHAPAVVADADADDANHHQHHDCPHGSDDRVVNITMIKPWIHHILVELFKNAMGSSVRKATEAVASRAAAADVVPPIGVNLYSTMDTRYVINGTPVPALMIDIIDQGTGIDIPSSSLSEVCFSLGHASRSNKGKWDRLHDQQSYAAVRSPLNGLGVGLHTSRTMIEHFGGSIRLWNNSRDGSDASGCTARVIIPVDENILERIPGNPVSVDTHLSACSLKF